MAENANKKFNALVVEDDLNSLEILTSILDDTSIIDFETARTGEQAIAYFTTNKPQITFLDIDIPPPDGIETLRIIRQIDPTAKVVMVTGCSDINTVQKSVNLGAFGYVDKPYVPEKILAIIRKLNE